MSRHSALQDASQTGVERRVQSIAAEMTAAGLRLDVNGLQVEAARLRDSTERLQELVDSLALQPVNVRDSDALARLLYENVGLPIVRRTRTGRPSTSVKTLRELAARHPLPGYLASLIERSLHLTHAASLLTNVSADGRIHPQLNSEGTETGRFTSPAPCLLALPRPLRRFVVAPRGCVLVQADYAHFELRALALLSGDAGLCARLAESDADPHAETASFLLGRPCEDLTSEERRIGKQVNFAIVFGQTPDGLAATLGCEVDDAAAWIEQFFDAFPGVKRWIEAIRSRALSAGEVRTLFDRRRILPELASTHPASRARGLRQAVNTVVQGTAAELFKIGLTRLRERLPAACRLLLPLHDGVLIEVPVQQLSRALRAAREALEGEFATGGLRLVVDLQQGPAWGCLRGVGEPE